MTISSEGWFGLKALTVIPVGNIESRLLGDIANALEKTFHLKTELGDMMPLPKDAYIKRRDQYLSTRTLHMLKSSHPFHIGPILGVADVDLYVPDHNFIFGEADPVSQTALLSVTRLRQEFYGLVPDRELFINRVLKEAAHELGHVYGLGHCKNPTCVMHFSNNLKDTDHKGPDFCENCEALIKKRR